MWYMCGPYCYYSSLPIRLSCDACVVLTVITVLYLFVMWCMCGPYCYYSSLPTHLSCDACVVLTVITVLYPLICCVMHVWSLLLLQFFTHPFVLWYICGPYCYYISLPVCHVMHVWRLLLLQFFTHSFVTCYMCGPYCYYSSLPVCHVMHVWSVLLLQFFTCLSCDACVVRTVITVLYLFVMWCMCGPYCYYSSLPVCLVIHVWPLLLL